jgi:calcineurin-like phosphoesterase family protein
LEIPDETMSNLYFIGDLHLGHTNAIKWRFYPDSSKFESIKEHDDYICEKWAAKITKNDIVYVCGDVAFTTDGLERLKDLPGRKLLVRGNHDFFSAARYLVFFEDICGITYKRSNNQKYWITHAPIHPDELRGGFNIHGHVHYKSIPDPRYFNVSAENIGYEPRTIEELTELSNKS